MAKAMAGGADDADMLEAVRESREVFAHSQLLVDAIKAVAAKDPNWKAWQRSMLQERHRAGR